ncbi:MAG: serine/threonine protein kinase [Candidatus Obscuribacter sp.]|jgi:serine/threonine protein kinase|nr:serine/threonine protein kinase [Candidatus Obscuribacter sp.]
MPPKESTTCPKCAKPVAAGEHVGSLTSFLFMDMHCQCHNLGKQANKGRAAADSKSCKRCGKVIAGPKRLGSFTGFLLGDLRCSCAAPLLKGASANAMETRYRPPQATWGKRKEQMQTAMRTRIGNFASDTALISLAPGAIVGGCYQLLEMIGKGGMGVVYKARHTALNRILALKFVAPSMVSRESWQLFQQEAKLNATLSHPSLCQIYDLGIHANALPYYAMDFVSGQTLEEIIINSGPLSVGATLEIFIKVAEGLSYAHRRNVVHRDIKPANIMISSTTGDTAEVKLLDFGIAELGTKGSNTGQKTERIIGSAAYMSPEQFAGRTTDARADIYSMGCSIFETLTGNVPFEGDDFSTMAKQHTNVEPRLLSDATGLVLPLAIEAIVKKCLHKMRDQRYQNASELAIDLQRVLNNKDLQFARPELATLEDNNTKSQNNNSLAKPLLISGLAIITVAGLSFWAVNAGLKVLQERQTKTPAPTQSVVSQGPANPVPFSVDSMMEISNKMIGTAPTQAVYLPNIKANQFYVTTTVDAQGNRTKVFEFPFEKSPAMLVQEGVTVKDSACQGRVAVSEAPLSILLAETYANAEELAKGFRPQDITGIKLELSQNDEHKLLEAALKKFKLTLLALGGPQWTPANIKLLPLLKPHSYLLVDTWRMTGRTTHTLPILPNVDTFAMTDCNVRFANLFEKPDQMTFKNLGLINTSLSKEDLVHASNWPNLNSVTIASPLTSAAPIKPLLEANQIKRVIIRQERLNLADLDIENLAKTKIPQQKTIIFEGLPLTRENIEKVYQLKKLFSNVEITKAKARPVDVLPETPINQL